LHSFDETKVPSFSLIKLQSESSLSDLVADVLVKQFFLIEEICWLTFSGNDKTVALLFAEVIKPAS
jgi:hypothetical protein